MIFYKGNVALSIDMGEGQKESRNILLPLLSWIIRKELSILMENNPTSKFDL